MFATQRGLGATFLAYSAKRPHLQAIELPSGVVRELRARADAADAAFSQIWKRTSWLALRSHQQLWSLSVPLSGKARLLFETWDTVPDADGRSIWTLHPSGDYWADCDQAGNLGSRRITRLQDERLEAVFGDIALVRDGSRGPLRLRRGGAPDVECGDSYMVVCQVGRYVAVTTELGATLDILDLATGTRRRVERVGFGRWGLFAAPSPNGSLIAIGCDLAPAPRPRPPNVPLDQWLGRMHDPRHDTRNVMVFIGTNDWTSRIVTEPFENFASLPAWTQDGSAVAFAIPFENRIGWLNVTTPPEFDRIRSRLVPLIDSTDLVGRGIA